MAMNIKNERVHALAREAASRTGRTQTSAIELALETLLADLDREETTSARLRRVDQAQALAAGLELDTEGLYDSSGLPR